MFAWSTSAISINITILCIVISTPQLTINKTRVFRIARTNFLYKFNSVNTPVLYIMRVIVSTHFSGSNRVTEHARACSKGRGKKREEHRGRRCENTTVWKEGEQGSFQVSAYKCMKLPGSLHFARNTINFVFTPSFSAPRLSRSSPTR